ncbi:putative porin [Arachidicoccus ginsenosidimutans]|uniref:putative porin n=1 Tax=Arachidicoccus sp. BS20 TaxID=1850526 RepID=UPI0018D4062E|nr:putative porin [Arachidicoccus sp. BS20]
MFALLFCGSVFAQINQLNRFSNGSNYQTDNQGRPMPKQQPGSDSLKLRDKNEDSITISYHYFDSSLIHQIDSSINDFGTRLLIPFTSTDLGNIGSPTESLLFTPYMKPGWNAGFHSMDPYRLTLNNTKVYSATRPYSVLGYMLGQRGEQYIDVLHTQPRAKGNVNFTFEYRLLNAPGAFTNQNNANSNLRVNIAINSANKRYKSNFIVIRNSMQAAINGGLVDPASLDNLALGNTLEAVTRLGSGNTASSNPFNASVATGDIFKDVTLYLRQSFDLGQKDSIMKNDTVVYRLFYPRLRFEHSIKFTNYNYSYIDKSPVADDYLEYYQFIAPSDTINFHDNWKELTNEFALYTYPVKKNSNQYLKLYIDEQSLSGKLGNTFQQKYNNIFAGAQYRNTTRNKKWDIDANGALYLAGNYSGNYFAGISLQRDFGKKIGSLQLGFQNVNQTPAYIFNSSAGTSLAFGDSTQVNTSSHSGFPVIAASDFKNQNITKAYAVLYVPSVNMKLLGNYYLYKNYTYFKDYFTAAQNSSPFNLLQIGIEKETRLGKFFHWYIEAYAQQKAGDVPLHVPALMMRNRLSFEGNFFQNLYIATGIEARYISPYKPDGYSPFTGQFYYQDDERISNRPDISFYVNFRIKRFKFFAEYTNLNTVNWGQNGFGFNHYNFVAPNYPALGLWLRVGIWWTFIN